MTFRLYGTTGKTLTTLNNLNFMSARVKTCADFFIYFDNNT